MKNLALLRNVVLLIALLFGNIVSYAQFQKLIGNANNNRLGKMILHNNHYYVLGQNGSKATVSKMDLNGNFVWTNQTNEDGLWNDVIVNKDGNLMTVGYQGTLAQQDSLKSNIGIINSSNGNFITIMTYNFAFRDLFSKIFENPFPSNPSFPYYVIGLQINTLGTLDDRVSVNMMNGSGTINARRLISGPQDLEVHRGFWLNNATGDFALTGVKFDSNLFEGAAVNFDKHATSTFMTEINNPILISNILQNGTNFIYSGQTTENPRKGLIWKQVGNTNFSYTIDGLNDILHVFLNPTETILYVLGVESATPNRRVLLTLDNTQNTIPIIGARVFENGETAFNDGFANLASNQKILYTDTRTGNPNSLGQQDGLVMVMDLSLQNCLSETITGYTLRPYAITLSLNSVTNAANTPPTPQIFNGTIISYQMGDPCAKPCNVSLQVNKSVDNCSNATFTGTATGGTGPYAYQWDISCNGVNGTSNPYTTQIAAGTIPFCVTVTDAIGCTAVLSNQTVVGIRDLIKPEVICPGDIQLPNITGRCFATIAPVIKVTDNCDPDPACNCNINGVNMPKNVLVQFNVGVTTVTCIATDTSGNVSQPCTFKVTVFDTEPPKIICPPNITISCNQNENDLMITGQATATDNCPGVVITYSDNFIGNSCSGTITRTWKATDASGAIVSCTQLIKKEDKIPHLLQCSAHVTINCDQQPLPTLTGMPQAVDNCQSGITPTYTDNMIGTGCNKYIQRTWGANDGCGNISTCVQNIFFRDQVAPVAVCPPNLTTNCLPADWMTANFGTATGTDNCGSVTLSNFNRTFSGTNCNGEIRSWWRATDECGIQNECYQTITVLDKVAPTIICPPNLTISCNASTAPANIGTATATDSCTGNISVRYTDAFTNQGCTQNLIRTWTANDGCGNMATCTQTITLTDNIAPNIMCPPNLTLSCGANTSPSQTGTATATDACQSGNSITFIDSISGGDCDKTITRTWTATDSCGNKATCVQSIRLVDKTPPTFICGSNLTPIECTQNPGNIGISNVMDNCGGRTNVTKLDVVSVNGCLTTIIRTWTVTDQCGNSATCAQEIRMQDTKPPVLSGCGRKITVQGVRNTAGLCQATINIISPSATDMCDSSVVLSNSFNNTSNASGTYPLGQTIITWTAKDDCGLMVMCQDTVVVLACSDCCYDRNAFDSIVSTSISITRNGCEISVNKTGLTPCQRLKFIWGDGQTSAYFTGTTITTSHDYGTSGDYLLCAVIEELAADSSVCFRDTICRDVCVTCGDGCTDDRIVYECGKMVGESNPNSELLVKNDLDYHNSLVYAASGEMNNGFSDACVRVFDINCNEVSKVIFTGNLDDYAGSVKYDKINDRLIVGGVFYSDTLYIRDTSNSFIKLANSGFHDGFVVSLDPVTLKAYWAFKIGDNWPDVVNDIAVNLYGDIYVGGGARNVMEFGPLNPSSLTLTQRPVAVGFIAKYDYNGNLYWYRLVEADKNVNIGVMAIDVDYNDNVYVGGFLYGIYHLDSMPYPPPPNIATIIDPPTTPTIDVDPNANLPAIFQDWTNYILKYDGFGTFLDSREIFPGVNFGNEGHQIYDLEYDNDSVYVVGSNMIGSYSSNNLQTTNWQFKTGLWDSNIKVQDGMVYTIGNLYNSYDQDHTLGGSVVNPSYSGIDFAVGIYALDGSHKKSMLIGGSSNERVAGLVTIPNSKDFFVQGLSRSFLDFHPNPESPYPILSNIPNSGDRNIFLGKYSCACEPDTGCCEDVSASFSGQDTCCKTLNLINNAGFDICKVTVELTTPGFILNTSGAASGYIYDPITNGIEISHTSGSLPSGSLNNLAEFCLSGSGTTLSTTQQFIVNWHENTTSGNKLVACTDTLTMSCYPPPPPDSCAVMNLINVVCDSLNPNVYNVTFTVTNLTNNITATTVYLSGLPPGFNFIPCGSGTYSNSIALIIFPSIGPGATSDTMCVQIYSVNPILIPTDLCFEMNLKGLDGNYFTCCEESEEQCITLTPCCLPCDDLTVSIQSTALGGKDRCCYDLSLTNACSYQYFTKMEVNILTPNVHFGYISPDANWTNCTPPTFQNICMEPNSGTIGSGNFNDVLQFCLSNVTSLSQIPQEINVKFYTSDINGLDSLACDTLIYLECPFKPTTNDSCVIVTNSIAYCDPETNKYNVSMTIMNNSNPNFCAQELVINLLEPGVANPSAIQLSDPLCYGESVTINFMLNTTPFPDIDGLMPLIISLKNLDGTCCRGGLAYIDTLVLPECPCTTTCCDSGQNEDFENYALGNLPNNQVGWVNNQGNPQVVAGGANGSGKSISLHAGSRGVRPASVSYGNSGVVGPDTIFQANKQYCITFWAKLLPVFNLNGRMGIYADGQLLQTIIIPSANISWTQYSFNFISPPTGQEILIFTNESPAPTDAGPGILLDQICFDEVIQIFDDMTPPTLSCPMDLTIQDTDLDCSVPYVIPNINITDPSGVGLVQCYLDGVLVSIGSTHNLTNAFVHTIKFVAEDVCGNRDSCSYKITVKCLATCLCPSNPTFTLKEGNKAPLSVFCNQLPTTIPFLDCPVDSITILGNFGCVSSDTSKSCTQNAISWTLDSPVLPDTFGIVTGPNFGVSFTASSIAAAGTYSLTLVTVCNGDTCWCVIKWIQRPCQTCACIQNPSFTIKEGNSSYSVSCNSPVQSPPVLNCPVNGLNISANYGCVSSIPDSLCPANSISWTLDRPIMQNIGGNGTGPNFSVNFSASQISDPGTYILSIFTVCGKDTCRCEIKWIQRPCPPTCICPANNNTITLSKGQQTFNLNCNSLVSALPKLNCPISPVLMTGNFGCISSDTSKICDPNLITYRLERPGMPAITGFNIGPNLNIILNAADISAPGIYVLHLATVCPGSQDTCRCQISWEQEDCTCCKDFRAFVVNTQNAVLPSIDPMTCKTTLNIANLHPCIKIDTIKWGDNMFTAGILPTGQMYMHTYASSGNFTIEITFSEYDSNGKMCWSNKVYRTINLTCSNVSCICNYKKFTIEGTPVDCNNAPALISCPNKKVVTITAQMGCLPAGCSTNITQYVIKDASNITVTSGTLSGSTLQLLAGWFDPLGGLYSIEFTTLCGSNVCKCKLNFIVPACPKKCLCDKDFEAEVGLGFSTYHYPIPICKKRFTPRNLCPKDKVIWTLNGISQDTSSGLDPVIFNILPSNSTVCMIVERMESPNKLCRDTICQFYNSCRSKSTPSILCNYPKNPTFDGSIEGKLNDGGMIPDWKLISGKGFVFTEEGIDFENVKLKASKNSPADLYQNCCLDGPLGKNVTISKMTFDIQNFGFEKLLPGSKIKIFSAPSNVTVTDVDLIGEVDISNISFGWEQKTLSFPATLWKFNNLVIRFENPSLEEASIRIDNLCMDFANSTSDDTFKNDFTLYPNPTTGQMTIQFASGTEQDYTLKVLDILGREVNKGIIDKGSNSYNFSIDDLAGIYIIQVTDSKGNSSQRKVIKIE